MKRPHEVAAYEKEKLEREREIQRLHEQRIKETLDHLVDNAVLSDKLTSKGGEIEYRALINEKDLNFVKTYFREAGWDFSYKTCDEPSGLYVGTTQITHTIYFFTLKPSSPAPSTH